MNKPLDIPGVKLIGTTTLENYYLNSNFKTICPDLYFHSTSNVLFPL